MVTLLYMSAVDFVVAALFYPEKITSFISIVTASAKSRRMGFYWNKLFFKCG